MNKIGFLVAFLWCLFVSFNLEADSFQGRYCELDGATTDSGEEVTGECYMYSDENGELDGAETESGEPVSGECYFY